MNRSWIFSLAASTTLLSCGESVRDHLDLHRDAIVADMHCDTVLRMREGFDFSLRDSTGQVDLPRLQEGGIDLQVFACWLPTSTPPGECRDRVDELIDSLNAQIARNSESIGICRTATEAERLFQEGRIAAFIGIENGVAIADTIENLDHFYDRGVRYMTLTHTSSNAWCISSADTAPAFRGLTDFGRSVVKRMNELGMIIDVSHASTVAVEEILRTTADPVIASHSCVHAICPHDRNLTDEQIRAIARNGGVIGVNFFNGYISSTWNEMSDRLYEARRSEIDSIRILFENDPESRREHLTPIYDAMREELRSAGVGVDSVLAHIDYVARLVGPDHVGLGSDFDGVFSFPDGLSDCSMMPNITRGLTERGYSEADVRKILGGNFLRVFRRVCDR